MTDERGGRTPNHPVTIEIDRYMRENGATYPVARDWTLLQYLMEGEAWPVGLYLAAGEIPGEEVMQCLGWMLAAETIPPEVDPSIIPFELISRRAPTIDERVRPPKSKVPGKPARVIELRNWLLAKNVQRRMEEIGPGSYDAAILEIAERVGVAPGTVKVAYDKWKRAQVKLNPDG
ncbi:hypothetical protein [Maricaulis sp.]|uniref:hypothetical protein n=1 Tax=Maricaulis sp. TaxID=1486257 RepID=UPI003A8F3F36